MHQIVDFVVELMTYLALFYLKKYREASEVVTRTTFVYYTATFGGP